MIKKLFGLLELAVESAKLYLLKFAQVKDGYVAASARREELTSMNLTKINRKYFSISTWTLQINPEQCKKVFEPDYK
jgi:hypothetical protein